MKALVGWPGVMKNGFILPVIAPDCPLPDAITTVLGAVSNHLKQSDTVRDWLTEVPKGSGTFCPDSPTDELVNYVATQRGRVDKSDPRLNLDFIRQVIFPVLAFEREQVLIACAQLNDVSQAERELLHLSARLAPAVNQLWVSWFRQVAIPYQVLIKPEQEYCKTAWGAILPKWDYTAFDWARGRIMNRRTWAVAFPAAINAIVQILDDCTCHDTVIAAYLVALRKAYACTTISELEACWAAVDRAWIRISRYTRIFMVHNMESGYEHPHCVSPEFRLVVRTSVQQDMIESVRTGTGEFAAGPFCLAEPFMDLLKIKLDRLDVAVFEDAIRGGCCGNFRIAGQAVPNRQDIMADGGKIFLVLTSMTQMVPFYRQVLQDNCPAAVARRLMPLITLDGMLLHACAHEFWHPAGRSAEVDQALGSDQE